MMKLPFFKNRPNPEKREYLFALEIGHETVKSAIWSVVNNKTQVLAIGTPVIWDGVSTDQLISAADKSLSDATTRLDDTGTTQPQKMVLGLPSDWVSQDKVNPEQLTVLKDLTQKLSLSAIGFVVTTQALVRHLQHLEGVPPTAILVGLGQRFLEVTLVRLGKIAATHLVTRSASVQPDIVEGLSRFGKLDMLPSRILIYDSASDLENIRQQLLSYPWQAPQTKLPFLHFPKIEALPSDFSIKAISLSGGSEVAQAIGLIPAPVARESSSPEAPPSPAEVTPADLGFYSDIDVADTPSDLPSQPVATTPSAVRKISLPRVSLPRFRLPRLSSLPLIIAAVLILGAGIFWAYWNLPKATVTLIVSAKTLQKQFEIIADSTVDIVDTQNSVLPARNLEVTVSGTSSRDSTGSKLVGDKAVGEVTIINGTAVSHNFAAGTVISAPDDLKFILDSSVSVASASGTADPNSYQPGKANVKVTAADIGVESNLSAGTQFQIGSFSSLDFIAKNDSAFTGGSSRQVAAVSKQDLTDLKAGLLDQLQAQGRDELAGQKLADDENLVDSSISFQTQSEQFDHQEGDVADQVKLDLTVTARSLAYPRSQLDQLVTSQISSLVPQGFEISGQPRSQLTVGAGEDNQVAISVDVSASLVPKIDLAQIAASIAGKSPLQAKNIISSLPDISEINLSFSPQLPGFLLTLPHQAKNILIEVESK